MDMNDYLMPSASYPADSLGLLGSENYLGEDHLAAVLFRVDTPEKACATGQAWCGAVMARIENRLAPFARTGGDRSYDAVWLDNQGHRQVIHLGAEGLVCLVGETPLDFPRLLTIGYWEIGIFLEMPTEAPGSGLP